jgi:predicted deacylase
MANGPCVMLSGGLHGDEVNGVIISFIYSFILMFHLHTHAKMYIICYVGIGVEVVRRIVHDNACKGLLRGTVLCIPILNIYGFLQDERYVPGISMQSSINPIFVFARIYVILIWPV